MQKVSVIIPVFNAEKHVLNCVKSLLNQTLKEMEFVFVDDCSLDNSIKVIKNYIKGNCREKDFIFLKTDSNSGPGIARNVGILESSGRYIAFMDSDDTVEATMYEELYKESEESLADICNCNAKYIKDNKVVKYLNTEDFSRCKLSKEKKSKLLQNFTTYICSYLYNREFIMRNNIFFPNEKSSEDSNFLAKVLILANTISHVNKPFYNYLMQDNSLTTTLNPDRYKMKISSFNKLLDELQKRDLLNEYYNELEYIYIKKCYLVSCIDYLQNTFNPDFLVIKNIRESIIKKFPNYSNNVFFKKNTKAFFLENFLKSKLITVNILTLFFKPKQYDK